jgi:hypothetical protein
MTQFIKSQGLPLPACLIVDRNNPPTTHHHAVFESSCDYAFVSGLAYPILDQETQNTGVLIVVSRFVFGLHLIRDSGAFPNVRVVFCPIRAWAIEIAVPSGHPA